VIESTRRASRCRRRAVACPGSGTRYRCIVVGYVRGSALVGLRNAASFSPGGQSRCRRTARRFESGENMSTGNEPRLIE